MEDIGKIVAGFAGGVAADEATRFITEERPAQDIQREAERLTVILVKDGTAVTLEKRPIHSYQMPFGDRTRHGTFYLFVEPDRPEDVDATADVWLAEDEYVRAEVTRVVGKETVIYWDGSEVARIPEAKGYNTLNPGYYSIRKEKRGV